MTTTTGTEVALVTGAGGFLGQHVVRELQKLPHIFKAIHVLDRKPYKKYMDFEDKVPVSVFVGDCTNETVVDEAMSGVTVVFHVAGKMYTMDVYINVDRHLYWRDNYTATETVIKSMRKHNVPWMVHTSDVGVYWGDESCINTREDDMLNPPADPYYLGGAFAESKLQSELLVRSANNTALQNGKRLHTVAVRPTLLYGEGDNFLVKHALSLCRKHGILWRVGQGISRVELAYAGNVAAMQALTFEKLKENPAKIAGQVFNCTELGKPMHYFDVADKFVRVAGYTTSSFYLPFYLIYPLTFLLEFILLMVAYLFNTKLNVGLPNTRMVRKSSHYVFTYDCSKAVQMLGYKPVYRPEEAMQQTVEWWKENWQSRAI